MASATEDLTADRNLADASRRLPASPPHMSPQSPPSQAPTQSAPPADAARAARTRQGM